MRTWIIAVIAAATCAGAVAEDTPPPAPPAAAVPDAAAIAALTGDPAKGLIRFQSRCSMCHRAEGRGTAVGPDLDGVGARLDQAALIRAITQPSAEIATGFAASQLRLANGRTLVAIVQEQPDGQLRVIDRTGRARIMPTADVAERRPAEESLMPPDVLKGMTPQQAADLVAYLAARREVPAK